MQTFCPTDTFEGCAQALDRQRLGKQRVECKQMLRALAGETTSWRNHSATRAWEGYEDALKAYYNAICAEWETRGYKHNIGYFDVPDEYKLPPWWGNPKVHQAYREVLIGKAPDWYGDMFQGCQARDKFPWWMMKETNEQKQT